jgi:hypothetical protein
MPDPTGKMFEATAKIKDEASETLDLLTDKMEASTKGNEDLQDGLKGTTDKLDEFLDKTKEILNETDDLGLINASLVGTKGKGSVQDQFRANQSSLLDFYKFVGNKVIDTTLSLTSATLSLAGALSSVVDIITGQAALAKFPGMLLGGTVEALKLVGVIEDLRFEMSLTNQEAAALGPAISNTMLQTGANIEMAVASLRTLGQEAQLATPSTEQLAAASVYMAEAWGENVDRLTRFNVQLSKLYEIGPTSLKGVASAMDHVARSTRISRDSLIDIVNTLSKDLITRIPKEFRAN